MIKKILKMTRNIILIIIILCIATIYIDYQRLLNGKEPVFNIREYNIKTKTVTYKGFFYKATREVSLSDKEKISESVSIKFKIFQKEIIIPTEEDNKLSFTLLNQQKNNCNEQSNLYYANKNIKVYTYCISSLKIKNKGKKKSTSLIDYIKNDERIIDNIINNFKYIGLTEDREIEVFKTLDDAFTNNKLVIYKCNKKNINDIYIAPINTPLKKDFCTYKDDDWSFLWEVKEEKYEGKEQFVPDLFYEDEKNLYELSKTKKEQVFLVTPKVRGKKETKILMIDALKEGKVTLNELKSRGLNFNVVDKKEREKELKEKEEKERKGKEQKEKQSNN